MLPFFTIILAAIGAAFVFRGHWARGLLVIAVANATMATMAAMYGRWGWTAFALGWVAVCAVGIAVARRPE